jgi:hypothetical protein
MTDRALCYAVGLVLSCALSIGLGQSFIAEHGPRKVFPLICLVGLAGGLVLGWALNAWIEMINALATAR